MPTHTGASFQECHLSMLRSLYKESDNTISAKTWKQIKEFLQQRPKLLEARRQRQLLQGIHDEAVKFVLKNSQKNNSTTSVIHTPQHHHHHHHHHLTTASPLSMFSPAAASVATTKRPNTNTNSLALVARLLGRRARQGSGSNMPFSNLRRETNEQMQQLTKSLETLQQEQLESYKQQLKRLANEQDSSTSTEQDFPRNEGKLVETEARIHLWSMLAHSLQQVE